MRWVALVMVLMLTLAACNAAGPAKNESIKNVSEQVEEVKNLTAPPVEEKESEEEEKTVEAPKSETGSLVAVVKTSNAELEGIDSLNVTFRQIDLLPKTGSKWTLVSNQKYTVDILNLDDDGAEIGLNVVPVGEYKTLRLQLKTGGDASNAAGLTSFSIPSDYLQVVKPLKVTPDQSLVLVFDMDVAKSGTVIEGTVLLKPTGTFTLLEGATVQRKGDGRVDVEGGKELFTFTGTFEQLLPPGTLEKAVEDCKENCPSQCESKATACKDECIPSVTKGCAIGGDDCRDKCDPYISPFLCRDNCNEEETSATTCKDNLVGECELSCKKKYAEPCIVACEAACA